MEAPRDFRLRTCPEAYVQKDTRIYVVGADGNKTWLRICGGPDGGLVS